MGPGDTTHSQKLHFGTTVEIPYILGNSTLAPLTLQRDLQTMGCQPDGDSFIIIILSFTVKLTTVADDDAKQPRCSVAMIKPSSSVLFRFDFLPRPRRPKHRVWAAAPSFFSTHKYRIPPFRVDEWID
jgi:hypothetical protein